MLILVARLTLRGWPKTMRIIEYVNSTFRFVMFHAKMEGEKFNHIFFITVGLHFRGVSMGSWTNMAYMGVTYMHYWILSIMVIVLASEIGSIFRSPALAKMLEQHKNNFIKLLGISEDSKRED